jgi:hypothetical protein
MTIALSEHEALMLMRLLLAFRHAHLSDCRGLRAMILQGDEYDDAVSVYERIDSVISRGQRS